MAGNLKDKIKLLPDRPGIYFFKNRENRIIYVGKARSLQERVKSYFQASSDSKAQNILSETHNIDFVLTDSEKEASFLENNFIRQYQPKFNLRLKDDKSFPYLKLTAQEKFPAVYLTRKVEAQDNAKYFGPFSPAHQARQMIHIINKYFGIRGCRENIPGRRKRPCLEYELQLCSAPCVGYISELEYRENSKNALLFLEGRAEELLKILKSKMKQAASKEEFEKAARLRDTIRTVEQIKEKPKLISVRLENMDIFGFFKFQKRVALYLFIMRHGKVISSDEFLLEERGNIPDEDILFNFLTDFYKNRGEKPDIILLPFAVEKKEALTEKLFPVSRKKTRIIVPHRGKNKKFVEMANRNAEFLLRKKEALFSPLEEIREILHLESLPERIEGFDISNTGGQESVGSCVVFKNGMPKKSDYRKYKINTVSGPNDVASLQEVMERRYRRVIEEKKRLPDLILVDGGKGQLKAAKRALKKLGLGNLPVISLAKKEEIIYTLFEKEGLRLERTSSALKLIQNIRNEAHRFAVAFHRQRRTKRSFESLLDGIPRIGSRRKKLLLARYTSIEEIRDASPDELSEITGRKAAETLLRKVKGNSSTPANQNRTIEKKREENM